MVLRMNVNRLFLTQAVHKYMNTCSTETKRVCRKYEHFDPRPPAPPGHQVKICATDTLQQICPPEPCQCPPKPCPLTNAERTTLTLLLLAKLFIFFAIVKYTNEQGIWTTGDETEELYRKMYESMEPIFADPKKPRSGSIQVILSFVHGHLIKE